VATRLEHYEQRYRKLLTGLNEIGFVGDGTLMNHFTRCGRSTCRCADDPPKLHGPYWDLTRKIDGKTVSRRLSKDEATLYDQLIANARLLEKTVAAMKDISAKATRIRLKELREQ